MIHLIGLALAIGILVALVYRYRRLIAWLILGCAAIAFVVWFNQTAGTTALLILANAVFVALATWLCLKSDQST